jgi:hypothetical protein
MSQTLIQQSLRLEGVVVFIPPTFGLVVALGLSPQTDTKRIEGRGLNR